MITREMLGWGNVEISKANTHRGIIVHYDGSNQRLQYKTCLACRRYWERTRVMHVEGNGWTDIGYAYGVCAHGEVYEGRGFGRAQAAARQTPGKMPNGNYEWVNITFMSGPDEQPTSAQLGAFQLLRDKLMAKGMKGVVRCHRDFTATDCPGEILTRRVRNGTLIIDVKGNAVKPKDFWNHEIPVPFGTEDNPEWQADSLLVNTNQRVRVLEEKLDSLLEAVLALRTDDGS